MRSNPQQRSPARIVAILSILSACASLAAADERHEEGLEEYVANSDCLDHLLSPDCSGESSGIEVSGWLAQGYTWNPSDPIDRFNGPVGVNDRANEYQLNQIYLSIGRDTAADGFHFGYRADVLYGTDVYMFQSLGLDDRIVSDSASRFYKLAFPQLYAEVYLPIGPGLKAKLGKWNALVGYETALGTTDFFYSKTFGYNVTAATNTGVLIETELGDHWTTSHGFHRGMCTWEDNNNALAYTGSIGWSNCDESTSVYTAISVGPEQDERADWQDLDGVPGPDAPGESLDRVIWSLTLEHDLTDSLHGVLNFDYLYQEGSVVAGFENAEAYGVAAYLFYDVTDRIRAGLRTEVYRDDDAFASGGVRSLSPAAAALYTNVSLGLNIGMKEHIVVRPEVRWDWQDRDNLADTPAYDGGTSARQFLMAFDVVASF